MTLLLVQACLSPADRYDAVRAACGLEPGEYAGLDTVGPTPVSEDCDQALRDSVGVDGTLGEPAAWTEPSSVGQMFVAGLLTIVATDMGTVGELEDGLSRDELIFHDLAEVRDAWSLEDSAPAGRFWFGWLTERVDRVRQEPPNGAARMGFLAGELDVYLTWPIEETSAYAQVFASVTTHEASHATAPEHLVTGSFEYDADAGGAYGVGARWLYEWMAHDLDPTHPDCPALVEELTDACEQIADEGDFIPCLEPFACEGDSAR